MENHIWKEDRLIKKDFCFECSSANDIHFHHVVPEVLGGTQAIPLCVDCHSKIHAKQLTAAHLMAEGRRRARERGVKFGRKVGDIEPYEKFMGKEKTKKCLNYLLEGRYTIREVAELVPMSINSVMKVKKIVGENDLETFNKIEQRREEFINNKIHFAKEQESFLREKLNQLKDEKRKQIEVIRNEFNNRLQSHIQKIEDEFQLQRDIIIKQYN